MLLKEIMSAPVATILPTASAEEARTAMRRAGIRHLVVRDRSRRMAGVLCVHDLDRAGPDSTAQDLMSSPAVTLPASAGVQEAAKLLRRRNIGSVVVMAGERLVGIVTASDLLELLGKGVLHVQETTAKWTLPKRGPTHRPEPARRA